MCGRYALGIRAAFVRRRLQQEDNMRVDEYAADDEVRETYNFAPGYNGLVYRAIATEDNVRLQEEDTNEDGLESYAEGRGEKANPADGSSTEVVTNSRSQIEPSQSNEDGDLRYKLQAMRWGLIPFWTKRNPDYGSMIKTINCRDDSLYENRGMWTSMKKTKRCVVVAQGFYEWLKKNDGKEKIPHFVQRKDGKLMCFAGLWDSVKYEGSDDHVYTYTVITTDSNKQLNFLHDRMPVILENGSDSMRTWLDPKRTEWSKDLQSLLEPFAGELECYAVHKDVGKVGNNSSDFIVPVASTQNKSNIVNFFANANKASKSEAKKSENDPRLNVKDEVKVEDNKDDRTTIDTSRSEDNAPMPQPKDSPEHGVKRPVDEEESAPAKAEKASKPSSLAPRTQSPLKKKLRSSTSNGTIPKAGATKEGGNQKITNFFGK